LNMKCPPKDSLVKGLVPGTMFICGALGKWSEHEVSSFHNGWNHWLIHNLAELLENFRAGPSWRKLVTGKCSSVLVLVELLSLDSHCFRSVMWWPVVLCHALSTMMFCLPRTTTMEPADYPQSETFFLPYIVFLGIFSQWSKTD
jgi:hypothetical protein